MAHPTDFSKYMRRLTKKKGAVAASREFCESEHMRPFFEEHKIFERIEELERDMKRVVETAEIVRTAVPPLETPEGEATEMLSETAGISGGGGMFYWGQTGAGAGIFSERMTEDPFYAMRRSTRLMRGGVPTSPMRAIRRVLYSVGGAGLAIAGVMAFADIIINIFAEHFKAIEAHKAYVKQEEKNRERIKMAWKAMVP